MNPFVLTFLSPFIRMISLLYIRTFLMISLLFLNSHPIKYQLELVLLNFYNQIIYEKLNINFPKQIVQAFFLPVNRMFYLSIFTNDYIYYKLYSINLSINHLFNQYSNYISFNIHKNICSNIQLELVLLNFDNEYIRLILIYLIFFSDISISFSITFIFLNDRPIKY